LHIFAHFCTFWDLGNFLSVFRSLKKYGVFWVFSLFEFIYARAGQQKSGFGGFFSKKKNFSL